MMQESPSSDSDKGRLSTDEVLTDPVVAAAYAEALADEEDLARQGLSIGDLDDELTAAGFEPVVFRVGQDGQPTDFYSPS